MSQPRNNTPSPPSAPAICIITPPNQRRTAHYRELGLTAPWKPQRIAPLVQAPVLRSIRQRYERVRVVEQLDATMGWGENIFRVVGRGVQEEFVPEPVPPPVRPAKKDNSRRSGRFGGGEPAEMVALGPKKYRKRGLKRKMKVREEEGREEFDIVENPKAKKVMLRLKVPESFARQEAKTMEGNGSQGHGE